MDLRKELHAMADEKPVGLPPLAAMLASKPRRRPPHWVLPLAVAASVLAVIGGVGLLDFGGADKPGDPTNQTPSTSQDDWEKLPTPPLSPRTEPIGAYVDGKVVVVGGSSSTWSGGPGSLPDLRDGAVFDPEHRTWQVMAEAPAALADWGYTFAVAGDRLIIPVQHRDWLSYDVSEDSWSRLPPPPQQVETPTLAVDGDLLYAVAPNIGGSSAPVQVLDLSTGTWSALPLSPHRPLLDDRNLVMSDAGLVMIGQNTYPTPNWHIRHPALAEVWDGHRWNRSLSSRLAGHQWFWTGERIISAYRITQAESQHPTWENFPAGAFDPATKRWSSLPWLPARSDTLLVSRDVTGLGSRVFAWGYLYDDATGQSTPVESPSTASHGTVIMTDGGLIAVGGSRVKAVENSARVVEIEPTNEAWFLPLG